MLYAKTEWGMKVVSFTKRYGISQKSLCERVGVKQATLSAVRIGKTPGADLVRKIDMFIKQYEAEHVPRYALTPLAEGM